MNTTTMFSAMSAAPTSTEKLSVDEYLKLSEARKAMIKATKIIPASLGGRDFGYVLVEYKSPLYKVR